MMHRRTILIVFLGFMLIAVMIHLDGSLASLLSDDFAIIEAVAHGGPLGMWADSSMDFFRPLASMLFWAEYTLWNLNPVGYRFVSVLLHSLCSGLVVAISLILIRPGASDNRTAGVLAILAGVLFLTSASHSEPISWTASQPDLLAAFFGLLALWCYIRASVGGRHAYVILSIPIFGLSLLSKESAVTLPLVLLAFEAFGQQPGAWGVRARLLRLVRTTPYFVTAGTYLIARRLVLGTIVGGYGTQVHVGFDAKRLLVGLVSLPTRTWLPPMSTRLTAVVVFAMVALGVMVAVALSWKIRRRPLPRVIPLLVAVYLVSLLPVIKLSISKTTTEGERLVYFPSAFAMLLLVAALHYITDNLKAVTIIVICLATASGLMLVRSDRDWHRAADLAGELRDSLEGAEGAGALLVFSLPDNLRGAFVFRRGFREMLRLRGLERKWEGVAILALSRLRSPEDSIRIEGEGNLIRVAQSNPSATFVRATPKTRGEADPDRYRLTEFTPTAYTLEFTSPVSIQVEDRTYPPHLAYLPLEPGRRR